MLGLEFNSNFDMDNVFVSIDLDNQMYPVGVLEIKNKGVFADINFSFHKEWLENKESLLLAPLFAVKEKKVNLQKDEHILGPLSESNMGSFGKLIFLETYEQYFHYLKKPTEFISEIDFLLNVCDQFRQGAVRFSKSKDENFVQTIDPKWILSIDCLPKLLRAADCYFQKKATFEDLRYLLIPSIGIGGKRPKFSLIDEKGELVIVKFTKKEKQFLIYREALALTLAKKAGLEVPCWQLKKIDEQAVLIIQRFDRIGKQRIPFLNGSTLLGGYDEKVYSYTDLLKNMALFCPSLKEEAEKIWKRQVFNALISSFDQHAKNYGFLYQSKKGWKLSPAFDFEIQDYDEKEKNESIKTLFKTAHCYGLTTSKAHEIFDEIKETLSKWNLEAENLEINSQEKKNLSKLFS